MVSSCLRTDEELTPFMGVVSFCPAENLFLFWEEEGLRKKTASLGRRRRNVAADADAAAAVGRGAAAGGGFEG